MNRRLKIYLAGVFLGCVLLTVIPRPFKRVERAGENARREPQGIFPQYITDGLGRKISVDRPPARLVSLAPSTTEILYALGAGERLVASTRYCNYPEAATRLLKIEMCGGHNIAASAHSAWPRLSSESLVAANPEVVIFAVASDEIARKEAAAAIAALPEHHFWANISAVRHGRVAMVDKAVFDVPGPRMVDALEAVAKAIHPEVFGNDGMMEFEK